MASLKKVRVQLLDEKTGSVVEEVDVLTSADSVKFADGETFQQKLDAGKLKGQKGDNGATGAKGEPGAKGEQGAIGPQGPKGADGKDGDNIKVGTDLASAIQRKLFFKVVD